MEKQRRDKTYIVLVLKFQQHCSVHGDVAARPGRGRTSTFHPMRDEKTYRCALFWHEQRHLKDAAGLRQEEGKMKGRKERKKEEINCTRSLRSSFLPTWYCLGNCPYLNKLISSVALLG